MCVCVCRHYVCLSVPELQLVNFISSANIIKRVAYLFYISTFKKKKFQILPSLAGRTYISQLLIWGTDVSTSLLFSLCHCVMKSTDMCNGTTFFNIVIIDLPHN